MNLILALSIIGIFVWLVEHAETEDKYLTWEELRELIKKEKEDEDKRTKRNSK